MRSACRKHPVSVPPTSILVSHGPEVYFVGQPSLRFLQSALSVRQSLGLTTILQNHPESQSAFAAIGGYSVPSFATLGSQVHHCSFAMGSMTLGTWLPQPHQEDLSAIDVSSGHESSEGLEGIATDCKSRKSPFCTYCWRWT